MYSRSINEDTTLNFGVSGKLWHGVLVMKDRETGSLWTQLDGRALEGELEGDLLEHVESTWTTWSAWVEAHPDTLVLAPVGDDDAQADEVRASAYAGYFADPEALFLPELGEGLDLLGPKDIILGLKHGEATLAVEEVLVREAGVLQVFVGSEGHVLLEDPATGTITAHVTRLDGLPLFIDRRTATGLLHDAWNDLQVAPTDLERRRVDRVYWYAWKGTHAGTEALAR